MDLACEYPQPSNNGQWRVNASPESVERFFKKYPTYCEPQDVDAALRDIQCVAETLLACTKPPDNSPMDREERAEQYVTLDQGAALVNWAKKTLERAVNKPGSGAPSPDAEGGGRRAHEWRWSVLRPWLEKTYRKKLPERFPAARYS
jgi:hypothetical protein